jgi:enoyl-CoA hydratase/carnithine racemase
VSEALAGGRLRVDEPAPHVARIMLANAAKRNALDPELLDALAGLLPRLSARCVILTGEGTVFSAGYDLSALDPAAPVAGDAPPDAPFRAALDALDAYPFPLLAAINGHAIGGGLELALCCDLRVSVDSARFSMPPAKLGIVYPPGGLRRFTRVLGTARAAELFLTARALDAAGALDWGIVSAAVPAAALADHALALATEVAALAPASLAGTKRALRAMAAAEHALDPALEAELAAENVASFRSADFAEGFRAAREKRPPAWAGR